MIDIDYIGIHYVNDRHFLVDNPNGTGRYMLNLFLTDIYISVHNMEKYYPSGTVILYTPTDPHYYHNPQNGFSNDWVQFDGTDVVSLFTSVSFPRNTPFCVHNAEKIHELFMRVEEEFFSKSENHELMQDALLRQLIVQILREQITNDAPVYSETELRFRKARSTILSHLEQPWTLEDMAALLDLSPSRFSHIYTSIFHISPKRNLLLERMNKARFFIQSQNYSVSEAANLVGYDNIQHFSKQFKLVTGKAPSEFHKGSTATD